MISALPLLSVTYWSLFLCQTTSLATNTPVIFDFEVIAEDQTLVLASLRGLLLSSCVCDSLEKHVALVGKRYLGWSIMEQNSNTLLIAVTEGNWVKLFSSLRLLPSSWSSYLFKAVL